MTSRRSFLIGAASLLAAPAIVRAESLMKLYVPPTGINTELTIWPMTAIEVMMRQAEWTAAMKMIEDAFIYGQGFCRSNSGLWQHVPAHIIAQPFVYSE